MLFIHAHKPHENESRFARSIRNIHLINQAVTENTILNLHIHLDFLHTVISKTMREIHLGAARHMGMLEKRMSTAAKAASLGGESKAVPFVFRSRGSRQAISHSAALSATPQKADTTLLPHSGEPGRAASSTDKPGISAKKQSAGEKSPGNKRPYSAQPVDSGLRQAGKWQELYAVLASPEKIPSWHRWLWKQEPAGSVYAEISPEYPPYAAAQKNAPHTVRFRGNTLNKAHNIMRGGNGITGLFPSVFQSLPIRRPARPALTGLTRPEWKIRRG
jgi:hypothetical protein